MLVEIVYDNSIAKYANTGLALAGGAGPFFKLEPSRPIARGEGQITRA